MMSLKSLFLPKELWSCNHPRTESFRVASVVRRNANSGCEAASDLRNWFEFDSSEASTWEESSAMLELAVDGLVRGLCSDRLFFEPNCTKSITAAEHKDKVSGLLKGNAKLRNNLDRETHGFLPLKENMKILAGFKMEANIIGEFSPQKENTKKLSDFKMETDVIADEFSSLKENIKISGGFQIETNISGRVVTLREHLKVKNHHIVSLEDDDKTFNSCFERNKKDSRIEEKCLVSRGRTEKKNSSCVLSSQKNVKEPNNVERENDKGALPFDESLILVMDSTNPYMDFRVSMEEMVKAFGLDEWAPLEEMLLWYLSVNGRTTHGYILGAFVDLLVSIVLSSSQENHKNDT